MEPTKKDKSKHTHPGLMSSLYKPLTPNDVKKIVDSSFEILERSGMAVYSLAAWHAFAAAGAKMDMDTRIVKLSKGGPVNGGLVRAAVERLGA